MVMVIVGIVGGWCYGLMGGELVSFSGGGLCNRVVVWVREVVLNF